ncbi:MAG: hypothetical protein M0R17_05400 [Candidatus Omnitrophica bacterium]|jgi:hypothetical protein|nr:hypothetical protein [Candidatus Omnitrophota bacterium]
MSEINLRNVSNQTELAILGQNNPELASLLQVYPPEMATLLINNKEKLASISKQMENFTTVTCINTMIMKCSQNCVYNNVCIFVKNDIRPDGFPCPIEKKVILDMEFDIVRSLEIDKSDPIEMEMLWDLIDAKLLDMRSSGALKDGRLTQIVEQKVGQAIVSREELSPNIEAKMELKRLKHNIIDSFVATRRAKKKYGMSSDQSTLEKMIREAAMNVEDQLE